MKSKVPTGDNIFAEEISATVSEGRSVAQFAAVPPAKGNGPRDAKAKRKLPPKPRGTNDAKTRKKIVPPLKTPGTNDAKTKRLPM